jgi:hypothetical protein
LGTNKKRPQKEFPYLLADYLTVSEQQSIYDAKNVGVSVHQME